MAMRSALWACSNWPWPNGGATAHWGNSYAKLNDGSSSTIRPGHMKVWETVPQISTPKNKESVFLLLLPCFSVHYFGDLTKYPLPAKIGGLSIVGNTLKVTSRRWATSEMDLPFSQTIVQSQLSIPVIRQKHQVLIYPSEHC